MDRTAAGRRRHRGSAEPRSPGGRDHIRRCRLAQLRQAPPCPHVVLHDVTMRPGRRQAGHLGRAGRRAGIGKSRPIATAPPSFRSWGRRLPASSIASLGCFGADQRCKGRSKRSKPALSIRLSRPARHLPSSAHPRYLIRRSRWELRQRVRYAFAAGFRQWSRRLSTRPGCMVRSTLDRAPANDLADPP